ncbi:uncharacterized protein N7443_010018 [Penicillium atrosanguineum]|uniref:uncharacterized protein n=1 Tax=Penicillium atrosanguineum TaxID=1132637 RepID=UPI0023A40DB3|nr:uncharacterized protein N7443_010018 [Penicillium atrosanguineum]KAJ5289765.1 hypothetical protein N7443_010018 [Penicillium atrosanguineum]
MTYDTTIATEAGLFVCGDERGGRAVELLPERVRPFAPSGWTLCQGQQGLQVRRDVRCGRFVSSVLELLLEAQHQ